MCTIQLLLYITNINAYVNNVGIRRYNREIPIIRKVDIDEIYDELPSSVDKPYSYDLPYSYDIPPSTIYNYDCDLDKNSAKGQGELQWPGLDDINEEIESNCNIHYNEDYNEDECFDLEEEFIDEKDIKKFVFKYNDMWENYYRKYYGIDNDQ